jgi:hypothetical protein
MSRLLTTSFAIRGAAVFALATVLVAGTLPRDTAAAGGSKQLQHVRGTIGYSTAEAATDFKTVFAKFDLPDDDFAVTRGGSAAVLAMPDSSLVSLGENTVVQVGAFDSAAASPGSQITLKNGALRFDIKRPQGGVANYRFVTTTSAVGVRGTVGLLSFVNGVTTVGCVACAADSVTVTVGTQTVALATGQILTVSAAGVITTGAITAVAGAFTAAGVPITAQTGAVAAGLPATGIAGVSAGTATAVGAAAVVTGTAIGIAASQPSPKPESSGNASTSPGGGQAGNISLNNAARVAKPTPSPQPPAARPLTPPMIPGPGPRGVR